MRQMRTQQQNAQAGRRRNQLLSSSDDEADSDDDEDSEGESDSDSMFEYELDSQYEEEKKEFDYDFGKEEFLNPVIIKGPDGTISIGTESRDKNTKEALCWNCQSHLIYR